MNKLRLFVLLIFGFVIATTIITSAQNDDRACPTLVKTAIDNVQTLCSGTERNQACYGNISVTTVLHNDASSALFETPGDIIEIADIESLHLGGMNILADEWGIAFMRVQANLPDTLPDQNATFVVFGDVDIQALAILPEFPVTVSASSTVNARSGPGTTYDVVDSIASGVSLVANGRNEVGDWLRVVLPDDLNPGWIATSLLRPDGDVDSLSVVQPETPIYSAMQAFYLQSDTGETACSEAPHNGLLIQAPQGVGESIFSINDVEIRMGSTAFFQAEAGNVMTITVIEGQAQVAVFDVSRTVPAGTQVTVPLDDKGAAAGPPSELGSSEMEILRALPARLLPDLIEIAAPLSEQDIAALDVCTATARSEVNLREGPGTIYLRSGGMSEGERATLTAYARGEDGFKWWRLPDNSWVREDVIDFTGDCDSVRLTSDFPPRPTPGPGWVDYLVNACRGTGTNWVISAGETIHFHMGCCGQSTAELNDAMTGGNTGWIRVDGVLLELHYKPSLLMKEGFYSAEVWANWVATSGTHTVSAGWPTSGQTACTITVP